MTSSKWLPIDKEPRPVWPFQAHGPDQEPNLHLLKRRVTRTSQDQEAVCRPFNVWSCRDPTGHNQTDQAGHPESTVRLPQGRRPGYEGRTRPVGHEGWGRSSLSRISRTGRLALRW
jgi:hypothetical protein